MSTNQLYPLPLSHPPPHKETVTTSDHFAASEEAGFSGTFMAATYHSNWSYDMETQRFFPQTYPVDKDPNPFKHPQIFVAAKAAGLNRFQRIKDVVTFPSLRVEYFKIVWDYFCLSAVTSSRDFFRAPTGFGWKSSGRIHNIEKNQVDDSK